MALVQQQLLVPDRDLNGITTGYTLRTIEYNDDNTLFGVPSVANTPKALVRKVPWSVNIPYRVVSTP